MSHPELRELETITLFTQPMPPQVARMYHGAEAQMQPMPPRTELVVEIASSHEPTLEQTRFPSTGDMSYWDIQLPILAARRLRDFYRLTHMRDSYPLYQCHSLPPFLNGTGPIALELQQPGQDATLGEPVRPCDVEAGRPYVTIDQQNRMRHSLLGVSANRPLYNLSVLGRCGPLAVTRTVEVCSSFGSTLIQPIIYESGNLALRKSVSSSTA